ncbi:MAG: MarR family transcriptional regulator [Burkholderiales bacterium]|nr:MarR family transcriptional regulator [Burkholderiales bacterium]
MSTGARFRKVRVLDDEHIGREARVLADDHSAVRLWLRLLSCSTQIEREIRSRLRRRFATTLPRFDYLAQLERHPEGLRMNALSRYLMVSGGNVTGLTDQLVAEGWVERLPDALDRRSALVRLTPEGRRRFIEMAAEHEAWLVELFGWLDPRHRDMLYETLGRLRVQLVTGPAPSEAPVDPHPANPPEPR